MYLPELTKEDILNLLPQKWACPYCKKLFKTERGAKIHLQKVKDIKNHINQRKVQQ